MAIEFKVSKLIEDSISKIDSILKVTEDTVLITKLEKIKNNWASLSLVDNGLYSLHGTFKTISEALKADSYYKNRSINKEDSKIFRDLSLEFELIYRTLNKDNRDFIKREMPVERKNERFPNLEVDFNKSKDLLNPIDELKK